MFSLFPSQSTFALRRHLSTTPQRKYVNPYAAFVKDEFEVASDLSFRERSKMLSAKWKTLSAEEKETFKHKYEVSPDRKQRVRGVREPKEKRPPTAYNNFVKQHFNAVAERFPGGKLGDRSKELGAMWKKLDEKEKAKYKSE